MADCASVLIKEVRIDLFREMLNVIPMGYDYKQNK